ncbi:RNA polymerase sigma factor [Actinoplanes sp. NPDC051859]|uniref:RNA polymerase sigma factor n=1 Tax=Actinoplanes sp. NPDC051859 TaxID=3363909 RepID=UPI0037B6542F
MLSESGECGGATHAAAAGAPDEVLARRSGLGDRDTFAEIVSRHGPAIYRYAFRLLDDPSVVEDCVQEIFADAWKGLPQFRGDSSLRTWLFTIARNRCYAYQRHLPSSGSRPHVDIDDVAELLPDPTTDPAQRSIEHGLLGALDLALRTLPPRQRSAWMLREIEGLTYPEIATVLSTTADAVRGLLERARATLATTMEGWR